MRAHQNDGKTGWRRRETGADGGTGGQYLQLETSAPFGAAAAMRARIFSTYIKL
jgi:hypothetical protein